MKIKKQEKIPDFIRPFLWSYDVSKMNTKDNKERIVLNVLNYGSRGATDWLFSVYDKNEIKNVIENSLLGDWDKKSLNFWSFIYDIKPKKRARF